MPIHRALLLCSLAISAFAQEHATGDWGGVRSDLEKKGVEIDLSAIQFAQGVAEGGTETGANGTGKLITDFKFDFGKLAGWNFWSARGKTETRYGGPLLTHTGGLNIANPQSVIPAASGTVFSITSVNVTKLIPLNAQKGDFIAVGGGRYNLLDLFEEDFFAGQGIDRFMNIAQVAPLNILRQLPIITNLFNAAWVKGGEPILSLAVVDPNDHALDPGLEDFFEDGVTFLPGLNVPTKHFGRTAKHSITGAITTKKLTPFTAIPELILPGEPENPIVPKGGSWSINYVFRQYLVERGVKDGWGYFAQLGFADKYTGPVPLFFNVGLGGNGMFESHLMDEFGIAYAYTDVSEVLKDNISPFGARRLMAEHQGEVFYNLHITPWLRLTGDLQFIRPIRPVADVAIVPGGRLELIF